MEAQKVISIARELRVNIQTAINTLGKMGVQYGGPATQLRYSRAWLGKIMGELGSSTPYPHANNPASPIIEPLADNTDNVLDINGDPVHDIKLVRANIESIIAAHRELPRYETTEYSVALRESFVKLREANFSLGFRLGDIRDNAS